MPTESRHPDEFSQYTKLPMEKIFLPFQLDVIQDRHIADLIQKGRQEGISWALAEKAREITGIEGHWDTFVGTKTKLLAKQFIQDTAAWAKLFRLIKSVPDAIYEDETVTENAETGEKEAVSTYHVKFPNRREVTALSSNPDAWRGWRGYKIADEFALHKQQADVLDALLPSRMWRQPITICSTHKGKTSEFNKLIIKYKKGLLGDDWNLHTIPITRAVDEGMLEKIYKKPFSAEERAEWLRQKEQEEGIRRWNQEYMCIPEDEEGSFFIYDQIVQCEYDDALWFPFDGVKKFKGSGEEQEALAYFRKVAQHAHQHAVGELYIGEDVGRDVNYTVICLLENLAGIRFVRAIVALDGMRFQVQQDCVSEWIKLPKHRRTCIDNRGIGRETSERLQERHGSYAVERIDASLKLKEIFAYAVLRLMLDKMLRYPADDTIRDDFHSIRKEKTDAGNIRYVAGKNETDENSHGDFYTAIALAVHAAEGATGSMDDIIEQTNRPLPQEQPSGLLSALGSLAGDIINSFSQYRQ